MTNEKYLVVNGGSSSLKFSLYSMPEEKELINGYIEKIGAPDCFWTLKINGEKIKHEAPLKNHLEAVETMMKELIDNKIIESSDEIKGVGHRIAHGAEYYPASVLIDDEVIKHIEELTKLVPLHHPGQIAAIKAMEQELANVPQVAVFDTSFHQTIPKENYIYAVPYEWYEKYGVRRYGFHGSSHQYITQEMQKRLGKKDVNLIICHIGSGASVAAVKDGKSVNTSLGMSAIEGLIMGTRCGSIDASIPEYVAKESGKNIEEVMQDLSKKSGLLGICGKNDFRDVEDLAAAGNEKAKLALEMVENSIVKYIAQFYFELNADVDAIVFTAGAGENDIDLRAGIMRKIEKPMNIVFDEKANDNIAKFRSEREGIITTKESSIPVYVIPTDEELMIIRDTYETVSNK